MENMIVRTTKEHMNQISEVLEKIEKFDKSHEELSTETGFLVDAVAFLCDYKKVLNNAIENAELKL